MNLRCLFGQHDWIAQLWPDHVSLRCERERCGAIGSAEFNGKRGWAIVGEDGWTSIKTNSWIALIQAETK